MTATGWVRVSCEVAKVLRLSGRVSLHTLVDLGTFDDCKFFTEWSSGAADIPVLRQWGKCGVDPTGPNQQPCEHYVPGP